MKSARSTKSVKSADCSGFCGVQVKIRGFLCEKKDHLPKKVTPISFYTLPCIVKIDLIESLYYCQVGVATLPNQYDIHCKNYTALADLGGCTRRAPPLRGPQFFRFDIQNFTKHSRLGSPRPPLRGPRPPMGNPGSATVQHTLKCMLDNLFSFITPLLFNIFKNKAVGTGM